VKSVNVFAELLKSMDPIRTLTFKKYNGEDLYNALLKGGCMRIANHFCSEGSRRVLHQKRAIYEHVKEYVLTMKPDLMVSVIPLINFVLLDIAKELNIPFLVMTTDLDSRNYVNGFNEEALAYDKFKYTLAFSDPALKDAIADANIPLSQLAITGWPVRQHFFEPKDTQKIKNDFNVPADKPVVMVLMGAAGSQVTERYMRRLARFSMPIHVLACVGRAESVGKKLQKIPLKNNVTMSVIGFTDRISDLMAISDVLITKPGPNTLCEAITSSLPMLLDHTHQVLTWERMNIDFVKKYGFGESIRHLYQVEPLLKKYLENKQYYRHMKENLSVFNHRQPLFKDSIKPLVVSMLQSA
jgi:UDP-N-acetylglucosamine:LPS N-acetylglucosamine transferase